MNSYHLMLETHQLENDNTETHMEKIIKTTNTGNELVKKTEVATATVDLCFEYTLNADSQQQFEHFI